MRIDERDVACQAAKALAQRCIGLRWIGMELGERLEDVHVIGGREQAEQGDRVLGCQRKPSLRRRIATADQGWDGLEGA